MGFDMGINNRGENKGNAKVAMNMEEFKKWLLRDLDADQDGKISKDELAGAVRRRGEWFAGWRARKGIRSADSNRNGVVDEIEIANLAEFAQKHFGIMIIC
ncbi:EF-HAND PAIR PROTEIN [Salix viminalis]|uniref:EF-HAND PAIR PROTEIN n=1 Tax=Salix viminalis TaxID=40686 RepID=A0A9Q0SFE9_SALVM|nr:EF-HAND PAIR PROTEIN [Salix viminalis]